MLSLARMWRIKASCKQSKSLSGDNLNQWRHGDESSTVLLTNMPSPPLTWPGRSATSRAAIAESGSLPSIRRVSGSPAPAPLPWRPAPSLVTPPCRSAGVSWRHISRHGLPTFFYLMSAGDLVGKCFKNEVLRL